MKSIQPKRVIERRRHDRAAWNFPVTLMDKQGRVLLKGHTADVSLSGVRVMGIMTGRLTAGKRIWVELSLPPMGSGSHPRPRVVKMSGEVRRVDEMGDWKTVSLVLDSNLPMGKG